MAVKIGTPGTNYLEGTVEDDKIFGDAGNDQIDAKFFSTTRGGNDYIDAEGGDDAIWAGPGNDTLYGGSGSDFIQGGAGNDYIDGGRAKDTSSILKPYMGPGHGGIVTNDSGNELYGEAGNDYILGGAGNDIIDGGFGNDTLVGGSGDDILNGYGTTINNDSQFDTLTGGEGADTFILGDTSGVFYNETGDGYAVIKDFRYLQNDKIQVKGTDNQYRLEVPKTSVVGSSAQDTEIYFVGGGAHERIGIVQDVIGDGVIKSFDFKFV